MLITNNSIGKEYEILSLQQKGFRVLPVAIIIPNEYAREMSEE